MTNHDEEITRLKAEIKALKAEMELQWDSHLAKEKEIKELQEKQHQEILVKQEQGFFKQKLELVSGFLGIVAVVIGAFIYVVKKLKEAKQEVKELLKK